MTGLPLRINVCNREGECQRVKLPRQFVIEANEVNIMSDDVTAFCEAITKADDELQEESGDKWKDNFDLSKQRSRNKVSRES